MQGETSDRTTTAFRFDRFFETSGELLALLTPDGRFLRTNGAYVDVLGYLGETLVGRSLLEITHLEDQGALKGALTSIAGGGVVRLESRFLHRDRSYRRLTLSLRHEPGDVAIYAVGRDSLPRYDKDDLVRRRAWLLHKIQAVARIGGWEFDARTKELLWTDETYRIFEVGIDHVPTVENTLSFYSPESTAILGRAFEACLQRGEPYDLDLELITAKKRRIWVRGTGNPIQEDGKIIGAFGACQDIHDDKRREIELEEKLAIIERQRAEIQTMSAPIIQVWDGVLALPVVGALDKARAADMTDRLLHAVVQMRAGQVILDLTGVEAVDEETADHLLRIIRATQLLGARSIVTGIRPAVAQILVTLNADLTAITSYSNLREAIQAVMRRVAR